MKSPLFTEKGKDMTKVSGAQKRERPKRRILTELAVVTAVCLLALGLFRLSKRASSSAWFNRVTNAQIVYQGHPSSSQLYQRNDGQLILVLREEHDVVYRILPREKKVYYNPSSVFQISSTNVRSRRAEDTISYGIDLGYVQGVKSASIRDDTNSRIVVNDRHIEFHSLVAKRVEVRW